MRFWVSEFRRILDLDCKYTTSYKAESLRELVHKANTGREMEGPALLSAPVTLSVQFVQNPCCRNCLLLLVWFVKQEKTAAMRDMHLLLPKLSPHSAFKSVKTTPDCFFSCPAHEVSLRLLCRVICVSTTLKHCGTKRTVLAVERLACSLLKRCWARVSWTGQLKRAVWQGVRKTCLWVRPDSHSYRIMAIP